VHRYPRNLQLRRLTRTKIGRNMLRLWLQRLQRNFWNMYGQVMLTERGLGKIARNVSSICSAIQAELSFLFWVICRMSLGTSSSALCVGLSLYAIQLASKWPWAIYISRGTRVHHPTAEKEGIGNVCRLDLAPRIVLPCCHAQNLHVPNSGDRNKHRACFVFSDVI
jgi:hypothetical protein